MNGSTQARESRPLGSVIGAAAHAIQEVLSPGDVAALRRLRPEDLSVPAFWRVCVGHLSDVLPEDGATRDEHERRWAVIMQAMAELRGLHVPSCRLGHALAAADIAEARVLRLLRAGGESLFDSVRVIARHLATTATPVSCTDLALLVLSDGRTDDEPVRRRIARDYYSRLDRKEAVG